ncbi:MAG: AraC family transcriptional regulator [Prevotella sp.]|nr:AraC family transcriptional regulator [Prevotella sp.]
MYEHQGLQDILFIMLYGGATTLAFLVCCYFLFTRGNIFSSKYAPPKELRHWAAAFMASVVASHIWWYVLGIHLLVDDRFARNLTGITLDRLTFVPLMMCVLVRMLQDRRRPLWPIALAFAPVVVFALVCIVTRFDAFELYVECYSMLVGVAFIIIYVRALREYGRWLHENFADLERKELWQSMLLLAFILFTYIAYTSNQGGLLMEYLAQVNTVVIIFFILWRVETLQTLEVGDNDHTAASLAMSIPDNIGEQLKISCEDKQLYLQHDLTLQQLAIAIGTNRTYLSGYFAQQGITYNAYINRLRIEYFVRLYRENIHSPQTVTAIQLAQQSGFYSYSTFSASFKKYMGVTATAWMKREEKGNPTS